MGTNNRDNKQGTENEGPDKAPRAHYAPKSKVVTNNVADPFAEAKANSASFTCGVRGVTHRGEISTEGWSKSKHR
jgi:hypothetical protein